MPVYFDDLQEGAEFETAGRTVTEADVVNFAGVSGDFNPLHVDATYAAVTPFGQRVAHGLLVLSMVSGLRQRAAFDVAVLALLEVRSWRFLKPVFLGDTIRARTRVAEKRATKDPGRGVVVHRVEVLNQRDEVVQSGELVLLVRRSSPTREGAG
ncbi:MAG: MaoC family dehydratase N-terminal domain-containing protein [Firmicutes bacterium]|nr:MaoC family dehydratase N-terminal domain-containing protein [Bacillota bacterium]